MNAEIMTQQIAPGVARLRERGQAPRLVRRDPVPRCFGAAGFGIAFLVPKEYRAVT